MNTVLEKGYLTSHTVYRAPPAILDKKINYFFILYCINLRPGYDIKLHLEEGTL